MKGGRSPTGIAGNRDKPKVPQMTSTVIRGIICSTINDNEVSSMPGCHINDNQVRLFMTYNKTNPVSTAAVRAGFSPSTGWRIRRDPQLPSEKGKPRGRRRPDPLADVFDSEVVPMLRASPQLRPVAIWTELLRRHPDLNPNTLVTNGLNIHQYC